VDEGQVGLSTAAPPEAPPQEAPPPEAPPPKRRRGWPNWAKGNFLLLPTAVWFFFLLVLPTLIIIQYSLGKRAILPPVKFSWNDLHWENYKKAVNSDFLPIFTRSIVYSVVTTVICAVLGFPLAYWIARFAGRLRNVMLVLVIIPFLTSYLIRIYAWQFILQPDGLLNNVLGHIGLGYNHEFLNTPFAVILGLTYGFLPFMILPLYASIERMDKALVEASYDLGHGKASTFFRVILPSVSPGLVAGVLLVFIPAVGDFITPELLGGVKTQMIGTTIADQFGSGQNWPLGSALSVLLMGFILIGVWVYLARVGEDAL
jgi:spermidine/putrescine transport system permease protein